MAHTWVVMPEHKAWGHPPPKPNEDEGWAICEFYEDDPPLAVLEDRKVALLMASAPGLLATLKMTVDALMKLAPYPPEVAEGVVAIVGAAHDVIKEAEGER